MGNRELQERPYWKQWGWGRPGTGRWWKRQLSKARRKYSKHMILYGRAREPLGWERECNWKLW